MPSTGGMPRSSRGLISHGITRITAPTESRCQKMLTRKRADAGTEYARSSSRFSSNTLR